MPLLGLVGKDTVWSYSGRSWMAGDHAGPAGIAGLFMNISRLTGGTFKPAPVDIVGNERHVVSIVEASASMAERDMRTPVCVLWTFDGDRLVGVREHIYDLYAVDAFWGEVEPGEG